jgi:hypothetical protein
MLFAFCADRTSFFTSSTLKHLASLTFTNCRLPTTGLGRFQSRFELHHFIAVDSRDFFVDGVVTNTTLPPIKDVSPYVLTG